MASLTFNTLSYIKGGSASYGAGGVCGAAVGGALYGWTVGPAGFIAMSIVGGAACAFSMWAAHNY